jgi:hypothetical protein
MSYLLHPDDHSVHYRRGGFLWHASKGTKVTERLFRFFRSFPNSANGKVFRVKQARIDRGYWWQK